MDQVEPVPSACVGAQQLHAQQQEQQQQALPVQAQPEKQRLQRKTKELNTPPKPAGPSQTLDKQTSTPQQQQLSAPQQQPVSDEQEASDGRDTPAVQAKPAAAKGKKAAGLEKTRQRNKAIELIAKYAGTYAMEAQKTKWVVELVMKVAAEGKEHALAQDAHIAALQTQLADLGQSSQAAAEAAAAESSQLRQKIQELEAALYNTGFTLHTAQREHFEMQQALQAAEETARLATMECQQLAAAVRRAGEQDARVRRSLAHQAFVLKSALVDTSTRLRGAQEVDRKEFREAEWRLRERERALVNERSSLIEQQEEHEARDVLLESFMLRLHHAETELTRLRQQQLASTALPQGQQEQPQQQQQQPSPRPRAISAVRGVA